MSDFSEVYKRLNSAQRTAVDTIEGPLLVIAGPGTGKTQLLGARVANILDKTDTLPQNILCLTFTESGAGNMRERLSRFIGKSAYDVQIGTYHAFGGDILRRFPEYFTESRLEQPIDELGKHEILRAIIDSLSYHDALKQSRHHLGDLISTISDVKRALLTANDLRQMAEENTAFITNVNAQIKTIFDGFTRMPTKFEKAAPYFEQTLDALQELAPEQPMSQKFGSIAAIASSQLALALQEATDIGKTKPLTAWKNTWLAKDSENTFTLSGILESRRLTSLANILERYEQTLNEHGYYDFDDMILRTITALETHDDLRFSLQEQYLYILLDEYQDTNAAQAKLVELLTNNPISEGRPNVMAVGDDDQAIYAFQGAQYSNMLDFYEQYINTTIISLTENYRSTTEVLASASVVANQITERLLTHFPGSQKTLLAANNKLPKSIIQRNEYDSDIAQNHDTARKIAELIANGTEPKDIAVLAPKHKQLESLVAHLNNLDVPVRYEKRENILESPTIHKLITMARLTSYIAQQDEAAADSLWPEVLSYDFWQLPISLVWQTSWSVSRYAKDDEPRSWAESLLQSTNDELRQIGLFFITLASLAQSESLEIMLDYLIGSLPLTIADESISSFTSPLRTYYTHGDSVQTMHETISNLTVLRAKVREHQATRDMLVLPNLLELVDNYQAAGQAMLNTSPYSQASNSVQLMTVYKSKGLEFDHVFLLSVLDDIWGERSRSNSNKLTLPANLNPIRHSGATEDERLRLFFVAITRAKFGVYLQSYASTYSGKATTRLKYLQEFEDEDGVIRAHSLPEGYNTVHNNDLSAPELATLETDWRFKHHAGNDVSLQALLENRLKNYQISPTHVNTFCDLVYGGPEEFFFSTILRFPTSPGYDGEFGNAIHESLQWLQNYVNQHGILPEFDKTLGYFAAHMRARKLPVSQTDLLIERGERALAAYLAKRGSMFTPGAIAEKNFRSEGVFLSEAHMAGKIDRLEVNQEQKTITVVDYKTGSPYAAWKSDAKLHKYKQQLYCYKLLIEGSHTYKDYTVTAGRLEFIEPDEQGSIHHLTLEFNDTELEHTRLLTQSIWQHVKDLNFPDIGDYAQSLTGIRAFENDLVSGTL